MKIYAFLDSCMFVGKYILQRKNSFLSVENLYLMNRGIEGKIKLSLRNAEHRFCVKKLFRCKMLLVTSEFETSNWENE